MAAVPPEPPTVFVHIGPPKTGTTYLQDVIWRNRALLREQGVTVPGARQVDHFHAALDLRRVDFAGHRDPAVPGAWQRLVRHARAASTPRVLISHEVFAGAEEDQIASLVRAFDRSPVHVVYGARDVARQLPAVWQESLKNRGTRSYDRFLAATLTREPRNLDRGFWRTQHAARALQRWSRHLPPERIHVMTLPQAGAAPTWLFDRFCAALGVDGAGFDLDVARSNTSLTPVDAEVLRRLNKALPRDLDWPTYERIVKSRFNELADRNSHGARLTVPSRHRAAVETVSSEIGAALSSAGYHLVGDVGDLVPVDASFGRARTPRSGRVARGAVRLLADVLVEEAAAPRGVRRRVGRLARAVRDRRLR